MNEALQGAAVLVTRPREQATELVDRLERAGALVILAPGIDIEPVANAQPSEVRGRDWLIFISRNAVRHGTPLLAGELRGIPKAPAVAAVGPGTAEELTRFGWPVQAAPSRGGGADDLLASAGFDVTDGDRVLIVRGEGGNEALAEALATRGADVAYLEVYRRRRRHIDPEMLATDWQSAPRRVTIVTSEDSIRALVEGLPSSARADLQRSRVVTISNRLVRTIRQLGFGSTPVVSNGAGAHELVAAARDAAAKGEETS